MPEENKDINPTNQNITPNEPTSANNVPKVDSVSGQSPPLEANRPTPQTPSSEIIGSNIQPGAKKSSKLPIIIFASVLGLALLSVGVVFGYILPNQPENLLKTAIANSLQETKVKYSGKLSADFLEESSPIKSLNVSLDGQTDMDNDAFEVRSEIAATGIKIDIEARGIDKNLYIKVGDLSTVKALATSFLPEYSSAFDATNNLLADQWIELDETLLKQANLECTLNSSLKLSDDDLRLIFESYDNTKLTSIQSSETSEVNGRSATKFVVLIDGEKAQKFGDSLSELSMIKKATECVSEDLQSFEDNESADVSNTSLNIWVDKKSKTISKIEIKSSEQPENENKTDSNFEITLTYGEANVEKPANAKPALQLFGELQQILFTTQPSEFDTLGANTEVNQIIPQTLPQLEWLRDLDYLQ